MDEGASGGVAPDEETVLSPGWIELTDRGASVRDAL
jgi:hypothetical protein